MRSRSPARPRTTATARRRRGRRWNRRGGAFRAACRRGRRTPSLATAGAGSIQAPDVGEAAASTGCASWASWNASNNRSARANTTGTYWRIDFLTFSGAVSAATAPAAGTVVGLPPVEGKCRRYAWEIGRSEKSSSRLVRRAAPPPIRSRRFRTGHPRNRGSVGRDEAVENGEPHPGACTQIARFGW